MLSYVYDSGLAELDELAAQAVRAVQPVNGLDPTTFSSVAALERELIGFVRGLVHGDRPTVIRMSWARSRPAAPRAASSPSRRRATSGSLPAVWSPVPRDPGSSPPPPCTRRSRRRRTTSGSSSTWCPSSRMARSRRRRSASRLGDDVALVVVSAPSYPFAALDPVAEVAALLPRARDPAPRRRLHRRTGAAVLAGPARLGLRRPRRHQHQRRPAQVRLRAQGRLGAAAARA